MKVNWFETVLQRIEAIDARLQRALLSLERARQIVAHRQTRPARPRRRSRHGQPYARPVRLTQQDQSTPLAS